MPGFCSGGAVMQKSKAPWLEETKADVRVLLVKGAQEIRKQVGGGTERELDLSLLSSCQIGQLPLPLVQFRKDALHAP